MSGLQKRRRATAHHLSASFALYQIGQSVLAEYRHPISFGQRRHRRDEEDALPIYQRRVEPTLERKNNDAYSETVGLLKKLRRLMPRLDRQAEFERYLEAVRKAHKPERNFMKLLNGEQW